MHLYLLLNMQVIRFNPKIIFNRRLYYNILVLYNTSIMPSKTKKKTVNRKKYNSEFCENDMTFQECEMAILRHAIDESEANADKTIPNGKEVARMITICEDFLIKKKLVCYGGTAINNILPKSAQFYDKETEIPDYDFYSPDALNDAKELADIYHKNGYDDVEAKSGVHFGTYKVFVNFIPMADITLLPRTLFKSLQEEAISIAGIKYAPANFLRMNMFLELSRPSGDISRWEKVLKRLTLLNTHYPFTDDSVNCSKVDFQRKMESNVADSEKIYMTVRDTFIDLGVIFFGGYAISLYSKSMPKERRSLMQKIPDFDVLSEDPEKTAIIVTEQLTELGFKGIQIIKHEEIGEIIPRHVEIRVGKETIAFIYSPIACHSYNQITIGNQEINVATIDTMLTFYLAFYYVNKTYYNRDRIICMAQFLFELEQKNRLEQKGLLKRFAITCYGKQASLEDIRAEKALKFQELADKKGSEEYQMWFLKYNPDELAKKQNLGKPDKDDKSKSIEQLQKQLEYDMRDALNPDAVEVLSHTPGKTQSNSKTKLNADVKPTTLPKSIRNKIQKTKKIYKPKRQYKKQTNKNKNRDFMFSGGCNSCMLK